jgi:phosphoribosyl-ATP pyrophosphohydrolase
VSAPQEIDSGQILRELGRVLRARRDADPESSYVTGLYARGLDAILKKVGEEAVETVIAGKGGSRHELVHEIADLWFHTLVLLVHQDIEPEAVLVELARRFGVSGHAEKAARGR